MTTINQLQAMGAQPVSTPTVSPIGNTGAVTTTATPAVQTKTASQLQAMGATPYTTPDNSLLAGHPVLKALGALTGTTGLGNAVAQSIFLNFTKEGKQLLADVASGKTSPQQFDQIVGGGIESNAGVIGSALQTALTIGTAGLGAPEEATASEATGQLVRAKAETTAASLGTRVLKQVGVGAAIGATGGGINAYGQGGGVGDIAKGAAIGAGTGAVLGGASELAATGLVHSLGAIRDSIYGTAEEQATAKAQQLANEVQNVSNDWKNPTTINEAKYDDARAVLQKTPEATDFLAQKGVNPFENIKDEKYDTATQAGNLRTAAGNISADKLRPVLVIADNNGAPKTAVADIVNSTIQDIQNDKSLSASTRDMQIAKAQQEGDALAQKYPKGMGLTDLHDEKIIYSNSKNGKYSPIDDPSVNNTATVNRALSRSMRTALENEGDKLGIPVKAVNSYLSKYYTGADYLDALNGVKAPVSTTQSLVRYASKIGVAKILGRLTGSDILSEFVGYHVGGSLEKLVESLINPNRDQFLKELSQDSPQAVKELEQFIKENATTKLNSLELPAGVPKGEAGNPIILPQTNSSVNPVDVPPVSQQAKRGFPAQDPVTGKMKATFTSESSPVQYVKDAKTGKIRIIQK